MKRFYRSFIDSLEEASTACADVIVVNSAFTAQTFASAFPSIATHAAPPEVLYPVVDFEERTEERSAIAYTKGACVCACVRVCCKITISPLYSSMLLSRYLIASVARIMTI